jgi:hypothetical protein
MERMPVVDGGRPSWSGGLQAMKQALARNQFWLEVFQSNQFLIVSWYTTGTASLSD